MRSAALLGVAAHEVTPFSSNGVGLAVGEDHDLTLVLDLPGAQLADDLGALRLHPQIRMWPDPLNVPIPAPRLMTVATNRDAMVAVANATRLTRRPGRSSTTRTRTASSACRATCSRTACGRASRTRRRSSARRRSAVLDRPEEERSEDQHEEAERRADDEPTVQAIEHRAAATFLLRAGRPRRGGA